MRRALGALIAASVFVAGGCGPATLGPPAVNYRSYLQGILQVAPVDPAPANAKVVAFIYTLPGSQLSSPLDVRQVTNGKLPGWTTLHPLTGGDALSREGLYLSVITATPLPGRIRYIARIGDPRDVRGEIMSPGSSASLVHYTNGTYAVRAPFLAGSFAVGFTIDHLGNVASVQFVLPLITPPPFPGGFRFLAVHD